MTAQVVCIYIYIYERFDKIYRNIYLAKGHKHGGLLRDDQTIQQ